MSAGSLGAEGGRWGWTEGRRSVLHCSDTPQKLESAIFNAVSLGQWELSRALFSQLAGQCREGGEGGGREDSARELLKLLIMEASSFWSVPNLTYIYNIF